MVFTNPAAEAALLNIFRILSFLILAIPRLIAPNITKKLSFRFDAGCSMIMDFKPVEQVLQGDPLPSCITAGFYKKFSYYQVIIPEQWTYPVNISFGKKKRKNTGRSIIFVLVCMDLLNLITPVPAGVFL